LYDFVLPIYGGLRHPCWGDSSSGMRSALSGKAIQIISGNIIVTSEQ
jgi:hypothetical protein